MVYCTLCLVVQRKVHLGLIVTSCQSGFVFCLTLLGRKKSERRGFSLVGCTLSSLKKRHLHACYNDECFPSRVACLVARPAVHASLGGRYPGSNNHDNRRQHPASPTGWLVTVFRKRQRAPTWLSPAEEDLLPPWKTRYNRQIEQLF